MKKEFQLDHCYLILHRIEKFKSEPTLSEKKLASANESLSPGKADGSESASKASRSESRTPSRPIGRKQAKRMVFTPDDEFRRAKLARIRAQPEAAQASAEKDRSIANDLAGIRRVIKEGRISYRENPIL